MRVFYSKMHGLGNDFMLVDACKQTFSPDAELVRRWARRRTGVGFDQLLVIEPCDDADFAFRTFNADGTEAQQCGNGARCVAHFARKNRLVRGTTMRALTGGRIIRLETLPSGRVCAEMGTPSFAPTDVPFLCDEPADAYPLTLEGRRLRVGVVSMGNPHAVTQVDDLDGYPVAQVGQALQSLDRFPESVNAGFMRIESRRGLSLRVFERGAGETPACGSGACAAVAVGRRWGLLDDAVRVTQRGGVLDVEWNGAGESVRMTGPAEHVYDGEIEYE